MAREGEDDVVSEIGHAAADEVAYSHAPTRQDENGGHAPGYAERGQSVPAFVSCNGSE
jgi:hypothetical protein